VVTAEEVKEVRAHTPKIPGGMTIQQLEIFKLGRAERKNWNAPVNAREKTPAKKDTTNKKQ
jgi:hypothetical protein